MTYSEAAFKTLKYRPDFPDRFGSIEDARAFCQEFFAWYNNQHRHSGVALFTPADVHYGRSDELLVARRASSPRHTPPTPSVSSKDCRSQRKSLNGLDQSAAKGVAASLISARGCLMRVDIFRDTRAGVVAGRPADSSRSTRRRKSFASLSRSSPVCKAR